MNALLARLSIRVKLTLIIVLISVITLSLVFAARIVWDVKQERQALVQELSVLSLLLSNRSTAALVFDDGQMGNENLAALQALPHITLACLYREDNTLLAHYKRDEKAFSKIDRQCPSVSGFVDERSYFDETHLIVVNKIIQDKQKIGWIYLNSDLSTVEARLNKQLTFTALAIAFSIALAILLALWLQRLISGPIKAVTKVAHEIELQGAHHLRAPVTSDDEVGKLALSFNAMLDALEATKREQQKSSYRFRSLIESTAAIPWEMDLGSRRFTFVGHQASEVFGFSIDRWYEEGFWDKHIHPDDAQDAAYYSASAIEQGEDYQQEYRMQAANGHTIWIHNDVQVIKKNHKPVRLQGFMFDIDERKRREEAIQNITVGVSAQIGEAFFPQMTEQLAKVFEAKYTFVGLLDKNTPNTVRTIALCIDGEIVDNLSYDLEHTPCEHVMGRTENYAAICAHPRDIQSLFPDNQMLVDLGVQSYIGAPLTDAQGDPIGLLVLMDDKPLKGTEEVENILTIFSTRAAAELERLHSEQALRKLSLAVEQSPNAVAIMGPKGKLEYANPAFYRISGYSEAEAISVIPNLLSSELTNADIHAQLWHTIEAGLTWRGELLNQNKQGETYWVFATISPITNTKGQITHFLSTEADISERKSMEEELRQHREELEELVEQRTMQLKSANKELESFSYSVSHDLRSPLRSIFGFSKILLEDYNEVLDDEGQNLLNRVIDNSQHMSELIDGLLALSRLGREALKKVTVDIDDVVQRVIEDLQEADKQRSVTISLAPLGEVVADKRLLSAVFENLIENAWKYSAKTENAHIEIGKLLMEPEKTASAEKSSETVYFVKDNGAGFDMAYVDKVFGTFQRLHKQKDFEGNGIGLATVQRIIHRHQGRIWAEAEIDKGATFYFTLGVSRIKSEIIG